MYEFHSNAQIKFILYGWVFEISISENETVAIVTSALPKGEKWYTKLSLFKCKN